MKWEIKCGRIGRVDMDRWEKRRWFGWRKIVRRVGG